MAFGQILSSPAAADGLTVSNNATSWLAGTWVVVSASVSTEWLLHAIEFSTAEGTPPDATREILWELGIGSNGDEVVKVQIPATVKNDTRVAYYMNNPHWAPLPEPFLVPYQSRLTIRVYDNLGSAQSYLAKVRYMEGGIRGPAPVKIIRARQQAAKAY